MQRFRGVVILLCLSFCSADIFLNEKFESGFIHLGKANEGELFYLLFKSRDDNPAAPLVWFFEGGPGMTSMHAVFFQNGPYRINEDLTLRTNEYSFNNIADVLFLDQPLGTGYSNVTNTSLIPHNEAEIVKDMLIFYEKFLELYPAYWDRPMYLVSQSYGSHFVLPLARKIHEDKVHHMKLEGVAMGNPWIRPEQQLAYNPAYTKRHNLTTEFHYIASIFGYTLASIFIDLDWDVQALDIIIMTDSILTGLVHHKFNLYDIRIPCPKIGPCRYNWTLLEAFITRPDVQRILKVEHLPFHMNNSIVFNHLLMHNEYFSDKSDSLIYLLDNTKMPVYIFEGVEDWWINSLGTDALLSALHWTGRTGFSQAVWRNWYSNGIYQGTYKRFKNLYYVHVLEAGHYVGYNVPSFGLDMLVRLVYGGVED